MSWYRSALLHGIAAVTMGVFQAEAQPSATTKPTEQLYQAGKIRVFFYADGKHAVSAADLNHNGVPDQVEDAATQTRAAYLLFVDALGFPDPFKTDRYGTASFLDIRFRHKDVLGSNGKAYDELQRFNHAGDPPNTLSVSFGLATTVNASSNLTPAHEFFHILQYSVTYFKNRWFTEGTARWSERALGLGAVGPTRSEGLWPLSEEKRTALFGMAYDASEHFWNVLAIEDDQKGQIPESQLPPELKQLTYANGTKVLQDLRLSGWRLIREVLHEFDKADDVAFQELGYTRWSEENQKSEKNNPFLMEAVMKAVHSRL